MRSESEVLHFKEEAEKAIRGKCKACEGRDDKCECYKRTYCIVSAYEASIPRDFWESTPEDVTHNVRPFKDSVEPYCRRLKKARAKGYGLLFLGDNGVGKTMFISIVLNQAIRKGFSAYYTTMLQLEHDLKRGFNAPDITERLDWMLSSDFVAIDEMGKERYKSKSGDHWMRAELERLFKGRCDDSKPMLLGSNLGLEDLSDMYGPTFASVLTGKYQQVLLGPGDFRSSMREKMVKDMAYGNGKRSRKK